MDDVRNRLMTCFAAVFPQLSDSEIVCASSSGVPTWDSVASVTLFATIEEEYGLEIDVDKMADLLSFQNWKNISGNMRIIARASGSLLASVEPKCRKSSPSIV